MRTALKYLVCIVLGITGVLLFFGTATAGFFDFITNAGGAFLNGITGGLIQQGLTGLNNLVLSKIGISQTDLSGFIGSVILTVLKWVANFVQVANDYIYSIVFGDLLILPDFQKIPTAGAYVTQIFETTKTIGFALAGFFFVISTGYHGLTALARSSWRDKFNLVAGLLGALLLIQLFPYIFSVSISLVQTVTAQIMATPVQGEVLRHGPTGNLSGEAFSSSPLSGLDLIAKNINDVLNLPANLIQQGKDAVVKLENDVQTEAGKVLDNQVLNPVNNAIGNGISGITQAITGKAGNPAKPVNNALNGLQYQNLSANDILQAGVQVLKIILSLASLCMILSLLSIKGFQLVSLLLLFLMAPLALSFMVLPNQKIAPKYFNVFLGIMGWNIIWAIAIKVYFICQLIVNASNNLSANSIFMEGITGIIPFAGLFMQMGVFMVMIGVAGWMGILAVQAVGHGMHMMHNQVSGLGKAAQVISAPKRAAGAVASAGRSGVGAAATAAGAMHAMSKNPIQSLASLGQKLHERTTGAGSQFIGDAYSKGFNALAPKSLNTQRNMSSDKISSTRKDLKSYDYSSKGPAEKGPKQA